MDSMPQPEARLGEEDALLEIYRAQSGLFPPSEGLDVYGANVNQFMVQSWAPYPPSTWNETYSSPFNLQAAPPASASSTQEVVLYPSETSCLRSTHNKLESTPNYDASAPSYAQPYVRRINRVVPNFESAYPFQTPQGSIPAQPLYTNVPASDGTEYPPIFTYGTELQSKLCDTTWIPVINEASRSTHAKADAFPALNTPKVPSETLTLDWSTCEQAPGSTNTSIVPSSQAIIPKRKHTAPEPVAKKIKSTSIEAELDDFVVVFENAPGALATVKRRRKLDAPVRKAARDVRKAGACHQCRFRKRTCSTGTPCNSCLKNGNALHELKCQRETPFIGKAMYRYFEYSSTRRVVSFAIRLSQTSLEALEEEMVIIDGIDRLSYPIQLRARRKALVAFKTNEQETISLTRDSKKTSRTPDDDALEHILILEDHATLGTQVEQWAVEYSSKFVHAAGPEFASTTAAMILGIAYVKKGLPESVLVATMLRVASLAFVLRAGVKCTPASTPKSSSYRTIQATIDTILYERLKTAEEDLFKMLQRKIFRSAGYLSREQVYPVALVLWQLLRILCLGASHLSNLAQRFGTKASKHTDSQFIALKLVLSTHLALFRSSNPLLLDFNDRLNQDLLQNDKELIKLAMEMRNVVLSFREKGFTDLKKSIAFKKEYFDMFRRVYDGL